MILKSLKDLGETAANAAAGAADGVVKTATGAADFVTDTAGSAAKTASDAAGSTVKAVSDTASTVAMHSENAVTGVVNGAMDTVDVTVGTMKGVAVGAATILPYVFYGGIAIAAFTAPVPTLIGAVILEVMVGHVSRNVGKEADKTKASINSRDMKKNIAMLEKYGTLPKNSVVENNLVRLEIDTVEKTTKGEVKKGRFAGKSLDSLDLKDLNTLLGDAPDQTTRRMMAAYIKTREISV